MNRAGEYTPFARQGASWALDGQGQDRPDRTGYTLIGGGPNRRVTVVLLFKYVILDTMDAAAEAVNHLLRLGRRLDLIAGKATKPQQTVLPV